MPCVWRRLKRIARWIYDWITILVASLVGVPAVLLDLLNAFSGVDIAPFVGSDRALKIVTAIALLKGLLAFIENAMSKKEE